MASLFSPNTRFSLASLSPLPCLLPRSLFHPDSRILEFTGPLALHGSGGAELPVLFPSIKTPVRCEKRLARGLGSSRTQPQGS